MSDEKDKVILNFAFEYSKLYIQEAINRAYGFQNQKLNEIAKISISMAFKLYEEFETQSREQNNEKGD